MSHNDFSESFWVCLPETNASRSIDVGMIVTEVVGIIPGIIVCVLLYQLDGRTRTSLLMLRTLTTCGVLQLLTHFVKDVSPSTVDTGIYGLNMFICIFWASRFLYWIFTIIGAHALVYFSANRAMQIAANLQFSFASSRNIDLVYIFGFTFYSVVITIPQVFSLVYDRDTCYCSESLMRMSFLQLVYAEVYVYFTQVLLVNGLLLLISCYFVIKWIRTMSEEAFLDTLNSLSFPNTPEEELKAYEEIKGWSTSSMCMVPLAVSFIISFAYDSTYQFISAIGLAQYDMNAIEQKMGVWLLLIHPVLIPYAVFYYIPALRFWVKKQWHRTTRGLFGRRREKWMKHSGDI